jgi:hypothetical protein
MADADDRRAREDEAILIVRHHNFMRYGINDVDEAYISSLSDPMLNHIIERDRELRERDF